MIAPHPTRAPSPHARRWAAPGSGTRRPGAVCKPNARPATQEALLGPGQRAAYHTQASYTPQRSISDWSGPFRGSGEGGAQGRAPHCPSCKTPLVLQVRAGVRCLRRRRRPTRLGAPGSGGSCQCCHWAGRR